MHPLRCFRGLFHHSGTQTIPSTTDPQMELISGSTEISRVGRQATNLRCSCTTPHEMQNEKYQAHDEQDVNHAGAYMKCQKSEQPENN